MKRLINAIIGCLILLAWASCELRVPLDVGEAEPKLVVNARMEAGKQIVVHVTESKGPLAEGSEVMDPIDDATVIIVVNGNDTIQLDYSQVGRQYMEENLYAEAGNNYEIMVSHPNYDTASSEATIPEPIKLKNVKLQKHADQGFEGDTFSRLTFEIPNPPGTDNYYGLEVANPDPLSSYQICFESTDPIFTGDQDPIEDQERPEYCDIQTFTDELMEEASYHYQVELFIPEHHSMPDSLQITLYTFDEASFKYNESTQAQSRSQGNPFAEPVIVYNNIKNGYGIFSGVSKAEKVIAW